MKTFDELREAKIKIDNKFVSYHKKAEAHHTQYANSHDTERTNIQDDDDDYDEENDNDHADAEDAHNDAASAHKKAMDAAKKNGTDSTQYKSAAKLAYSSSENAHGNDPDFESIKRSPAKKKLKLMKTF
jgi:hypothetical protein|tara:strand:- start:560 stop:946 length:387 start_codon:yes stop_codon:yes gene_type:complete